MKELIIGTRNRNKVKEIKEILCDLPISLIPLYKFPSAPEFVEDGNTFAENSEKKCRTILNFLNVAAKLALPEERFILSEDSGLVIEALGGKPGIYSARFAGPEQNDRENIKKVLDLMKDIPWKERKCFFITVASLYIPPNVAAGLVPAAVVAPFMERSCSCRACSANVGVQCIEPEGRLLSFEGRREGRISFEPKGNSGFGYDPIFFDPKIGKTFGEISLIEKNKISHRHQALSKVKEFLLSVI